MRIYKYTKTKIAHRKMSDLMYAIIVTKSKLVNVHHLDLQKYTRKQNTGNVADIVIEIDHDKVDQFEELSGVELKSGEEFQGNMKVN